MNTRFCQTCRRSFGDLKNCPDDGSQLKPLPDHYPEQGFMVDGRYDVDARIADGGMARIYRARDTKVARDVACKVLHPNLAIHPYTVERFYRQARVALHLQHPSLVETYQYGPGRDGHHLIVMELLPGESLASVLAREGRLPWERTIHMVLRISEALGYAHGQGVVHRDIKPENLQVSTGSGGGDDVWLLDFGIAQVRDEIGLPGARAEVMGTPAYMSPEQIRGEVLDGRSDLYALGVLLYEMLSGERPFNGDDPVTVCRMQLYDRPAPLAQRLPRKAYVPPALKAIVDELLVKSRSSRLSSVGALLGRLHGLLPGHVASLPTPPPRTLRDRPGSGYIHRLPTGETVTGDLAHTVLLLHVQLQVGDGRRPPHEITEISELLAGWRALVESSSAFLREPMPGTFQIVFGLFRPRQAMSFSLDATRFAVELGEIIGDYSKRSGDDVSFRASITRAATQPPSPAPGQTSVISPTDAKLAAGLAATAPVGAVVVDGDVASEVGSELTLKRYKAPKKLSPGDYRLVLT